MIFPSDYRGASGQPDYCVFPADWHKNAFKICVLRYFLTFRMRFL
ncbi:hypothetical protein ECEC1846_1371 [Escherichia coli EC1846]|uniref:Uncharacterized protein n=4 Tax=Escherichia coli TaxID=562 RepID=A0A0H3PKI2_ECO5C|nr:hypothetical protein ECH74115_1334 [Escherichia coli O157:H7 str. EC4115]ACT71109.1 hypothetical protein ECSP_1263 [Escherichia coli O157:H7 str. TW14359]AEE55829.1 conserved hypothetical protein [Escherichia coli UMNK88]AIG67255.1 hypothetical protein EDL933_1056 [Escherichia coli O157:H7 str. EDL933]AJA25224.1 hypothetical protein SS52_1335 [Escherichia coli O157:H7 str. SS52]AOM45608.1 hypothetical protein FORC28_2624 [Escherichia coli]EDU34292.1 hypothetical protein ECH7EC4196_0711 [Es